MELLTYIHALLLGLIEGATEFIPVSSTGHLILFIDLLQFKAPPGKTFEIIIQLGAILAVCWYYRMKLWEITTTLHKSRENQHFAIAIIVAFLPAACLGVLFHDVIKTVLFSPELVAINLIIGGIIILIVERKEHHFTTHKLEDISLKKALAIGFAQALAMMPGVSRSGATIIGSLLMGVNRKVATEFSFFLAIPTMLGATVYDVYKNYHHLSTDDALVIGLGFFSAFVSALLVVSAVISFIGKHGFTPFGYYRIMFGSIMLAWLTLF